MPFAVKNVTSNSSASGIEMSEVIESIYTWFYLLMYIQKYCNNFLGFCYVVLSCNFTAVTENPSSLTLKLKRHRLCAYFFWGGLDISLISIKDCLIKI